MKQGITILVTLMAMVSAVGLRTVVNLETAYAQEVTATRLRQNPLITPETSSSLGTNINGPTVIRVPASV